MKTVVPDRRVLRSWYSRRSWFFSKTPTMTISSSSQLASMRSRVVFLRTPTPILMSRTATTSAMTESRTYSGQDRNDQTQDHPTEDTTSENKCLASPSSAIDRLLLASFIIAQARIPLGMWR